MTITHPANIETEMCVCGHHIIDHNWGTAHQRGACPVKEWAEQCDCTFAETDR